MTQVETRQYSLAVLIILIIFCWPAALLYYFTCPKVVTQQGYPNQAYSPGYQQQAVNRFCPQCGRAVKEDVQFCPNCGKQLG